MIKVIATCLAICIVTFSFAQTKGKKTGKSVPWLSPLQVESKWNEEKKPILVDVYTDWCHYCKIMDNTTWSNPKVSDYIAQNFYAIKFNAESKEPVSWMGKAYEFKSTYKVHMLAAEWLQGNMVYPSTVLIPPGGDAVVIPGVLTAKDIEPMLKYFGEGHYLTTEWKAFQKNYKTTWN